jgi:N-acetylglutamate synthase/N-acetylornithine aminotransferase
VRFDPNCTRITLAGIPVFRQGRPLPFDEAVAHQAMLSKQVTIVVDLGGPRANRKAKSEKRNSAARHSSLATRLSRAKRRDHSARVYTCDFTAEYVRINASYRT